ncbi:MAG: protein translocase subunit SecD [Pseudomonadota bacterium]|nr:protein translocase subunit SecD [Pseudomonadota bacterium]
MNYYSTWKNLLIIGILFLGAIIALPNIFGKAPSIQVIRSDGTPLLETTINSIKNNLTSNGLENPELFLESGYLLLSFTSFEEQLQASAVLNKSLSDNYVIAFTLVSRMPDWLRALGLKPMSLGLDLRGGVHFLYEVDLEQAISQRLNILQTDISRKLRSERIRRNVSIVRDEVRVRVGDPGDLDQAEKIIQEIDDLFEIKRTISSGEEQLTVTPTADQVKGWQDFAIQQNTITLRNRVNQLGVAEPLVQRQGLNRIVVQLPGVQDPTRAKEILKATATLEFRMVCENQNAFEAQRRARAPLGCELFEDRNGAPVLLKRDVIVTGDQLTDAAQGFSDGLPMVSVSLDSKGADEMLSTTKTSVGKQMAVLFIEQNLETSLINDKEVQQKITDREVISVATIQGVFSSRFQITGLELNESRDLALLLRAGALAAPVYLVEERTVGPSLGQDNIERGRNAILIGLALVITFMALYYKAFGLIADLALFVNLVMIISILSLLQASLTLPGIAGIVLTVGMAVDANVLIFERIREELSNGNSPQASIHAGYEKAFSTIADANVTTFIAAVVLFAFGTGPIKGFAITLAIGIATSMFTSIIGTRAVVNFCFGRRKLETLPI